MKKQLLLFFGMILTINCYSQISFEKGYYIDNEDQKIECFIKNSDWNNNPSEFEYKISENDEIKIGNIKSVKEFEIYNISKYLRKKVEIDTSSDNLADLSDNKNPIFEEKQLFLKVLVTGKANLYLYKDESLRRYFYSHENSDIEQLVYKLYFTSPYNTDLNDHDKIGKNIKYRQQLWNSLKCSTIRKNDLEGIDYKKNSLIKFFSAYNKCANSDFTNYEKQQQKDLFNLNLRPRLNNSSLTLNQSTAAVPNDIELGSKLGFGFGVEAEFILPWNKNKWAFTIETVYQSFKAEKTFDANVSGGTLTSEVDYSSIEIPAGLRYYIFLNKNSKIFMNASYVFDLSSKSAIDFKRADDSSFNSLDVETQNNLAFGLGSKLNDKFSLEMRYQTNRELLGYYSNRGANYRTVSVIFGYSLF